MNSNRGFRAVAGKQNMCLFELMASSAIEPCPRACACFPAGSHISDGVGRSCNFFSSFHFAHSSCHSRKINYLHTALPLHATTCQINIAPCECNFEFNSACGGGAYCYFPISILFLQCKWHFRLPGRFGWLSAVLMQFLAGDSDMCVCVCMVRTPEGRIWCVIPSFINHMCLSGELDDSWII